MNQLTLFQILNLYSIFAVKQHQTTHPKGLSQNGTFHIEKH